MGKKLLILFGTLIAIFLVASAIIYFGSSPTNNSATNETKAEKTSDKTTFDFGWILIDFGWSRAERLRARMGTARPSPPR